MKIEVRSESKPKIKFGDLSVGAVFKTNKAYYLKVSKTQNSDYGVFAVILSPVNDEDILVPCILANISLEHEVEEVSAKLIIED